jgi:hypothetical protein
MNLINDFLSRVVGLSLILVILVTGFVSPISAAPNQQQQDYENVMEHLTEIEDANEVEKFKEITNQKIKKEELTLFNNNIDYSNSKLYQVEKTNSLVYSVPLKENSQRYHEVSNITIFYDEEYNVTDFTELHIKESVQDTFQVTYYLNANEIANEITNDKFTTAAEHQDNLRSNPGFQTMGVDFGGIANCLGLTFSVGAALAVICGSVCLITAGTGCALCIGAYVGYDISTVTGCIIGNIS